MSPVNKKKKRKNDANGKNNIQENNLEWLTCSRVSVVNAVEILRKRIKEGKINRGKRAIELPRCKERIQTHFGTLSPTHLCVQLRNALIVHNWEAAAHFLLLRLKFHCSLSYPQMWRSFFILLQHHQRDNSRMEKFVEMCCNLMKQENVLDALYLHMDC